MKANNETLIQWPRAQYWDKAWNPYIGCVPCSPACVNCYARALAKRFKMPFTPHQSSQYDMMPKWWKNKVLFCGNMTDLWGDWVEPWEQRAMILDAIDNDCGNTYLWLTKRHERLIEMLKSEDFITGAMNHAVTFDDLDASDQFFGVTAEDYEHFMLRVPPFQEVAEDLFFLRPWISFEPLLGRVPVGGLNLEKFRWFVVGCESGPNRRPCEIEWVEEIVELAKAFHVPVFVKQLDINGKCVTDITKFPKHLQIRQVPWHEGKEGRIAYEPATTSRKAE